MGWVAIIFFAYVTVNGECHYQEIGLATNNNGEIVLVTNGLNVHLKADHHHNYNLMYADSVPYSFSTNRSREGFIMFVNELKETGSKRRKKFKSINSYIISTTKCN